MRSFSFQSFFLVFILIDRGSLGVELAPTNSRKGLDIDLNVAALPEEEPPIISSAKSLGFDLSVPPAEEPLSFTPVDSASSPPASSTVIAPGEIHDLAKDKTESLAASSTSVISIPTLGSTSADKRKQITEQVYGADERDQNPSKKQQVVVGARKNTHETPRTDTFQLGAAEKAPKMKKLKEVMAVCLHRKYRTQPKSTRPGYTSEVSTFFSDWEYVKVDKGAQILSPYLKSNPSQKLANEKDLFKFLKKLNRDKSAGVFWVQRGKYETRFFSKYSAAGTKLGSLAYPPGLKNSQRSSANVKILLEMYKTQISHLNKDNLSFLEKIKTQFKISDMRIERIKRLIKISTVLSVIYLSLYKEHPASLEQHLRDFTGCIERLLRGLRTMELKKGSIAKRWHQAVAVSLYQSNAQRDLSLLWRTIEYWTELKKNPVPGLENLPIPRHCHTTLTEIIGKILFFSNCNRKEI
ncbi:hypothetical protein PCANC_28423 [Puccinia coronata f. sp. avenae]|uniref:Nucleolus and neural progenitor protein-like N-terminal domain-containing protein n=1 Tax=Puccinia coronata f. sp. avenae TaxID=200324 RepID=A0A2N5THU2_9BASI|nr:hypothetical protein PCANC_28423 [Puccinia coronata f. sp. avenae]